LLEASEHLARAAALQPSQTQLWEQAGRLALAGGDAGKAIEFLERVRQELPLEGRVDLGQAYAQSSDLHAAAHAWQAIFRFGPSVEVLDLLSQAYFNLGDYLGASSALELLLVLRPEDAGLHYRLGLLLAAVEPGAAVEHLEEARRLNPELEEQAGKLRGEILAASLEGDPAYTLVSAGRVLAASNEWELAAEAFTQATLANRLCGLGLPGSSTYHPGRSQPPPR
jgi:tetratricopeptide (TPR) repeat protein